VESRIWSFQLPSRLRRCASSAICPLSSVSTPGHEPEGLTTVPSLHARAALHTVSPQNGGHVLVEEVKLSNVETRSQRILPCSKSHKAKPAAPNPRPAASHWTGLTKRAYCTLYALPPRSQPLSLYLRTPSSVLYCPSHERASHVPSALSTCLDNNRSGVSHAPRPPDEAANG
jgi:hypothetical protein